MLTVVGATGGEAELTFGWIPISPLVTRPALRSAASFFVIVLRAFDDAYAARSGSAEFDVSPALFTAVHIPR
ncbi:hypothetical protein [Fodinicola acaciae]|uniref:hypothetical protein n=1 Tax=Fodinicola acaciae TaxID=2681555 RepID=UPI0013CFA250|nr:hypothetical protein [Fodinicola acaciae]